MWFQLSEQSQVILNDRLHPVLPSHRWKHGSAVCSNAIYLYGGRDSNRTLSDLWKFDIDIVSWEEVHARSERPPPLQEHSMVAWNRSLYVFGGEAFNFGPGSLWIFSVEKQRWRCVAPSRKTVCPSGRRGHSAVVHRDHMFIFGGYQDLHGSLSDLWTFDLKSEVWSPVDTLGIVPCPRHCHISVTSEEDMYVHGGMSNLTELGDIWKWNFESRKWRQINHRGGPKTLHSHVGLLVDGYLFIFGGVKMGEIVGESWKFQLDTLTWEKVLSPLDTPSARARSSLLDIPTRHVPSILEALHSPTAFLQVPLLQLHRSHRSINTQHSSSVDRLRSISSVPSVISSRLGLRSYSSIRPDFGIELKTYQKVPTTSAEDEHRSVDSYEEPDLERCASECGESAIHAESGYDLKCLILCGGLETVKPAVTKTPLSLWVVLL